MHDLGLAIAHHILVFALVAQLAAEWALLKGAAVHPKRLARLDAGYGATAMLVLAVGASRVIWGGKGWAFYADNPFFWGKIGAFLVIGLLSIGSTVLFAKWRRSADGLAEFQAPAAELRRARLWVGLQALVLPIVLACAAAMARWPL